jgi:hypothetical protein
MHPLFQMPRKAGGGEVEEMELPSQEPASDLVTASHEFIQAINSGDAHEVAEAFKAMMDICDSDKDAYASDKV